VKVIINHNHVASLEPYKTRLIITRECLYVCGIQSVCSVCSWLSTTSARLTVMLSWADCVSLLTDADGWTTEDVRLSDGSRVVHDQSCLGALHLSRVTNAWCHPTVSVRELRRSFVRDTARAWGVIVGIGHLGQSVYWTRADREYWLCVLVCLSMCEV